MSATCARCSQTRCECPDYVWRGEPFTRSPTVMIDQGSEPGSYDRFFRQRDGNQSPHLESE